MFNPGTHIYIYKYNDILCLQPVFLNRTLSYMRQRMSRSHKPRKDFSVDCLMEKIVKKNMESMQLESVGGYMTLTFLGFYDKKGKYQ